MPLIELPKASNSAELGSAYTPLIARTAGLFLQVIAPAACVIAAFVSWFRKRRRTGLLKDAEVRTNAAPLANLTWLEFEELVGADFERLGYAVSFTPQGADGGVDVIARKGSETFLIQCKQWRAPKSASALSANCSASWPHGVPPAAMWSPSAHSPPTLGPSPRVGTSSSSMPPRF